MSDFEIHNPHGLDGYVFGAGTLGTTNTERFLPPGNISGLAPATAQDIPLPYGRTFSKISFRSNQVGTGTGAVVTATMRVNGSNSSLSVSFDPATASGSTTISPIYVAAGSYFGISITKTGTHTLSPNDFYVTVQ